MFTYQQIDELTIPTPETFTGMRSIEDLLIYEQNLPHWRQEWATYAVTIRFADSIPKDVLLAAQEEKKHWQIRLERERQKAGRNSNDGGTDPSPPIAPEILAAYREFLRKYSAQLELVLDECHGSCLLRARENQKLVERALFHFDEQRYHLFAYVVMPNHCHAIVQPLTGFSLESLIGSWKKFTSRRIVGRDSVTSSQKRSGNFWQVESHDRIIRDETHFRNAARYILRNPLKANLREGDFAYFVAGVDEFEGYRETIVEA